VHAELAGAAMVIHEIVMTTIRYKFFPGFVPRILLLQSSDRVISSAHKRQITIGKTVIPTPYLWFSVLYLLPAL
jgi:hypothetical protein